MWSHQSNGLSARVATLVVLVVASQAQLHLVSRCKSIRKLVRSYKSLKEFGITLEDRTWMELRDNVSILNKVCVEETVGPD